jgi:hypothetical protein
MTNLINLIINISNLETNVKYLSVIDSIKYDLNYDEIIVQIKKYKPKDEVEKYMKKFILNPQNKVNHILQSNYHENYFDSLYFVIGNYYTIDSIIFDKIYDNLILLDEIPQLLINKYNDKKIFLFYNDKIIKRWISMLSYEKLNKVEYFKISKLLENKKIEKWEKYIVLYNKLNEISKIFKKFLKELKLSKKEIVGSYNIGKKYYEYCLESHLGMKVNINKLLKWGFREIEILQNKLKSYFPEIKEYKKILKRIKKEPSQKYESKDELITHFKEVIKKYENLYIKKYKFPQYEKVNLVIFSNSKMAGGYYANNNFYLNLYFWKEMRKYTVESLVLHETIPGHHTQVHTMLNIKYKYPIFMYYESLLNGFIEGWGLYSETLGVNQTMWDKIGQIEYDMLRTLRIIVDINIHYYGKSPENMIKFMQNYLTMSKGEIEQEVYRYVCLPGQAVSYKVGSDIFKQINKNNSLTLCKKLIMDGPLPLEFLIKKYKIKRTVKYT